MFALKCYLIHVRKILVGLFPGCTSLSWSKLSHPQSGSREAEHRPYTTHVCSPMLLLYFRGWCSTLRQDRELQNRSNVCRAKTSGALRVPSRVPSWHPGHSCPRPGPLWCHLVTLGRGAHLARPASISFQPGRKTLGREGHPPIPLSRELWPNTAVSMFAHTCIRIYYCHALLEG